MADQPTQWSKLACDSCGSRDFLKRIHIITRAGGGTTEEPAGFTCRQCNADVDLSRMIQRLDLERKREELRQLQQQVGDMEPEPPASGRKGEPTASGRKP